MTPSHLEAKLQQNTIELLQTMGYTYIPPKEIHSYKEKKSDLLLKPILKEQLQKLNNFVYKGKRYPFSEKNILNAIKDLDYPLAEGLLRANQKITEMLTLGKSYVETLEDGSKRSFSFRYIDFEEPNNNLFYFTQEFRAQDKRIDLVLFINGIPIAAIELKASNVKTNEGISQMIRNQKEVPELFKFMQILIAGNNHSPRYATVGTPLQFWALWREDIKLTIKNRLPSELDRLLTALFDKKRILELIENFIIFDKGIKKIARYQQYFAIKKILARSKQKSGGVVWHTQGSGKSLTMVMLTKLLKKEFVGSKVIVVTDRKELDRQIFEVFSNSEISVKRATSSKNLIKLLQSGTSVVTTLVHKFQGVAKENIIINDRVFVLVDESHRTQGGELHQAMKKVFPNGIYLAFTGTPLLKREKSTYAKFGGEIHRYTIDEAVRDGAVVRLLYEGRMVDQWIKDQKGLDRKFAQLTRNLSKEQIADLKRKWSRFQKIASSQRRLEMIALDIEEHFLQYLKNTPFKAMLATSSKYDALKFQEIFQKSGKIKTAVIISPPDTREGETSFDSEHQNFVISQWQKMIQSFSHQEYEERTKEAFLQGDIELLIVVDKLLTGFDAPKAKVLYIDKELKEHNLLQAIARVNRLYQDKEYGLIIDYRGLLGELDRALTHYSSLSGFDESDLTSAVFDVKEEIAKVKIFYSHLLDLFSDVPYKDDMESYEVALANKTKRERFYQYLSHFAKALQLALTSQKSLEVVNEEEIATYKERLRFFIKLKEAVKLRFFEKIDTKEYESSMRKLLDTFLDAGDIVPTTKPMDIFDVGFEAQIEQLATKNAKADMILSAVNAFIKENFDKNPAFYEKLSQRIEEVLEDYKQKRIDEEEKLKEAQKIKQALKKQNYPSHLTTSLQRALFDNIHKDFFNIGLKEEVLIDFIKSVDKLLKEISQKPDWQETQRNTLEALIDDLFYEIEDKFGVKFDLDILTPKIVGVAIANY